MLLFTPLRLSAATVSGYEVEHVGMAIHMKKLSLEKGMNYGLEDYTRATT